MSTYMRGVALSEDIIYVIDEKGCVAQAIIEANDILNCSINNGIISEFVCNKLIHKLCYVLNKLESIYDEISKISESENPIPEMTNNNYSPGCKKSHIQFMVSKELKEYIANKADSLNMSISQFLRVSALTERKVIVLGKGNYVSRYLIELQNKLNVVLKEEKINLNRRNSIESTFKDIFKKFIDISLMLTIPKGYTEEQVRKIVENLPRISEDEKNIHSKRATAASGTLKRHNIEGQVELDFSETIKFNWSDGTSSTIPHITFSDESDSNIIDVEGEDID